MKVLRYRPAFFSGYDDEYAEANTIEELLAIPWVYGWTQDKDFHRLSLAGRKLMCEIEGGRHWYVVAFLNADHLTAPGGSLWDKKVQCTCSAQLEDGKKFKEHAAIENVFGLPKWEPVRGG